jgi:pimeloyl-ACP methyl ester carboxylesterase
MAEDGQTQRDTEDVPDASTAFQLPRTERRDEPAVDVSRAAALLTLIRPKTISRVEYEEVTEEVRELLDVQPVEPQERTRESIAVALEEMGGAGSRAAQIMYEPPRRRQVRDESADDGTNEVFPGSYWPEYRRITREIEPRSGAERELIDAVQRDAASTALRPSAPAVPARGRAAERLIAASLLDEEPLVRVAAAAATLRLDQSNPIADAILEEAEREAPAEVAELSRAILQMHRGSERRRIEVVHPPHARDPAADTAIVHGTWARWGRWWRPDGLLHQYLRDETQLFPHLYADRDPFEWSGYFNFRGWAKPYPKKDWHRQQAADSLAWWAHRKLVDPPDFIGHSYGGSLAMLATRSDKQVRGMVLLSPAVHRSCLPNDDNYEHILHVTMKLDLVLLADLSRAPLLERECGNVTRFRVKRKGLGGHGGTHNPQVWRDSGLDDHVRDEWLPKLSSRP